MTECYYMEIFLTSSPSVLSPMYMDQKDQPYLAESLS